MRTSPAKPGGSPLDVTWLVLSNMAYPIAGLAVVLDVSPGNPLVWVFALAMLYLGVGSTLYHAGAPKANHLDVSAMYAVSAVIYAAVLGLSGPLGAIVAVGIAILAAWGLRWGTISTPMEVKVGGLYAILLVGTLMQAGRINWGSFVLAMLVMGAALVARFAPVNKQTARAWWDTTNNRHGWWHVFSALGLTLWFQAVI